ncbi:hypothetical protein BV22DRAFT_138820 [Leucogyrophana mollusca]|uniref:Uncharacterized protein n=1 Tax=Leucogyrophana mollusca TaxID=85980 RepID=A0ACB8BVE5_9AGAM|nr:hypothetical protein BV22DRAFT_138820 [Leucogyrophana mollusca]
MYRLSERVLAVATLALAGLQGALAQGSAGQCLASSGYGWATNSLGQDPCQVANDLFAANPCSQSGISYPPLKNTTGPDSYYVGPSAAQSTQCTCNTVIYGLASACGLCQNGTFLYWSEWTDNCYANDTVYQQWPASIASGTTIPPWAYMPLVNGFWDGVEAKNNACKSSFHQISRTIITFLPLAAAVATQSSTASSSTASSSSSTSLVVVSTTSTAPSTHSTAASTTSASASATGSGTSGAGRVAGGVGGGFAGAVLLAFFGVF